MANLEPKLLKMLPPQLRINSTLLSFNVAWTFLAAHFSGNWSQVDRVWPILPPLYTAVYVFFPLFESAPLKLKINDIQPRPLLMMFLQIIWSLRLSAHAYRRGILSLKEEDYRWPVFKKSVPNKVFQAIFNFSFVALFQNCLLYALSLPAYTAASKVSPLDWNDGLVTVLVLLSIAGEYVADNQQWVFHKYKNTGSVNYAKEWPGSRLEFDAADRRRGFLTKGLWAYSRHPNVACEQLIWLFMSLFPILSNKHVIHNFVDAFFIMLPSLTLCFLVFSSTVMTESISSSKYPGYKFYQQRVPMFWPIEVWKKLIWLKCVKGDEVKKSVESAIWGADLGADEDEKAKLKDE